MTVTYSKYSNQKWNLKTFVCLSATLLSIICGTAEAILTELMWADN